MNTQHMDRQVRYVDSEKNPLYAIKAYIALAGAIATGLLGSGVFGALDPEDPVMRVLTLVSALATAMATYKFPNAEVAEEQTYDIEDGYEDAEDAEEETVDYADEDAAYRPRHRADQEQVGDWADEADDPLPIEYHEGGPVR